MNRRCEYVGGCVREASKLFQAEPVKGWLCEEHFQQVLHAAAEEEAADRRKFEGEWQAHFEKYVRENKLDPAELNHAEFMQIFTEFSQVNDGARRWLQQLNKNKYRK